MPDTPVVTDRPLLTPMGERALRELCGALVDPGDLCWDELRDRLNTTEQSLSRVANRLAEQGLIEFGRPVAPARGFVRLSDEGWQECLARGWRPAART